MSEEATTCLVGDPDCEELRDLDDDALPQAIAVGSSGESISFGGFLFSDGQTSQLCSALIEVTPPECATVTIDIDASIEVVLEHVAKSFGNPGEAKINIVDGVYWTDEWVNLSGSLVNNALQLDS